ncbi:MAG: DUF502 domain-containing protein [Phycisphaerales bacterium]|jgi:uncharacterized membrane protein|nr:DUF502 domain-containing protein [Phycisphaerales bacterium]
MSKKNPSRGNFRRFFLRGLAVVLPATLTLWILVQAYLWVNDSIAEPINSGIRYTLVQTFAAWPTLPESLGITPSVEDIETARVALDLSAGDVSHDADIVFEYQAGIVKSWWADYWPVRLIGLLVAIFAVYLAGRLVGGWVGRASYRQLERVITSLPVIKKIYSWIKQIVDFLFSHQEKAIQFRRVVAVEYPKKGIWSVGFQTGTSLRALDDVLGDEAITIFIPSSPTPFTGYTISVPRSSTVELPLTVEEAIGFTISGGVLRPPSQNTPRTLSDGGASDASDSTDEKT